MSEILGFPPPEMVFLRNILKIKHLAADLTVEFNAIDALKCVDKESSGVLQQIACATEWQKTRYYLLLIPRKEHIDEKAKEFDWTFQTQYAGSVYQPAKTVCQIVTQFL